MEGNKKRLGLIPSLPQAMIEEILSRILALKPLLRFKCVSKSWCSIISSRAFIKTHLKNSIKNARPCTDQEVIQESLKNKKSGENSTNGADSAVTVGFVDGLCLVVINKRLLSLVNRCTQKFNNLPPIRSIQTNFKFKNLGLGGFDEEHKVLVVLSLHDLVTDEVIKYVVKMYTLGSDSWKIVKGFKNCSSLEGYMGILVNGKLHWSSRKDSVWEIVSFDLANEVSGLVAHPDYMNECYQHSVNELKGCLSVFCNTKENRIDIWMLKEYEVKDSWSKVFRLPNYPQTRFMSITRDLEFLCLYNSNVFVFYDPETNSMRHPRTSHRQGMTGYQSLVSPFHI